jgi:phage terminase large subunit
MLDEGGILQFDRVKAYRPLYRPKRFKVYFGGRGSAKSWEFAQAIIVKGISKTIRVLCGRELQKSIEESVHQLLVDTISRLEVESEYAVYRNRIEGRNGTKIFFSGIANNTTAIKSMEGIDIVWLEEAENISQASWDVLIPTFRKQGSEIWVSFNPWDEMDATYQQFVVPYLEDIERDGFYEDDRRYIRKVNYNQNPYFEKTELFHEMLECKENDYNKYLHIWEGECNADYEDSIIKPEWVKAAVDAHIKLGFDPKGVKSLGFDPADSGTDNKAIVYRHGSVIIEALERSEGDISTAIDWAFDEAERRGCTHLIYDGVGIGAAVKDRLRNSDPVGRVQYEGFLGAAQPYWAENKYENDQRNVDVFKNLRGQGWWYMRDRFYKTYMAVENGKYYDPNELISLSSEMTHLSQLRSELVRVQRKRNNAQQIQVESKDDMRKRQMPSPNLADALVYSLHIKNIRMAGDSKYDDWSVPING